jgi:hypothetical protein
LNSGRGKRGYVDLYLRRRTAREHSRPGTASAASRPRPGRRLWGRDHGGRFRTHGHNSHATVRGTRWLVEDRCDGTLTRVTSGTVVVRDRPQEADRALRRRPLPRPQPPPRALAKATGITTGHPGTSPAPGRAPKWDRDLRLARLMAIYALVEGAWGPTTPTLGPPGQSLVLGGGRDAETAREPHRLHRPRHGCNGDGASPVHLGELASCRRRPRTAAGALSPGPVLAEPRVPYRRYQAVEFRALQGQLRAAQADAVDPHPAVFVDRGVDHQAVGQVVVKLDLGNNLAVYLDADIGRALDMMGICSPSAAPAMVAAPPRRDPPAELVRRHRQCWLGRTGVPR